MFKTILASLSGFGSDRAVLDAAVALARPSSAHIDCLHTRIDPVETAAIVATASPHRHDALGNLVQKVAQEQEERSRHAQSQFRDACARHALKVNNDAGGVSGISAHWEEVTTIADETLHAARFHDLAVLARDAEISAERMHGLVMQAGRPVLIAPARPISQLGQTVAIAWKEGPDAARAVSAAMPLLAGARQVLILSVSEQAARIEADRLSAESLARQLRWHGIAAKTLLEQTSSAPASEKLRDMAYGCGADLLVMGAFGHSRLREFVFGGVTRSMLGSLEIPVFMFH